MDKGAHFYRCDFQVHSPRDLNWSGTRPTDEAGRKACAESLIAACREKKLNAIAITDHHDLVFFPYVKNAAVEETDEQGQALPKDKQIVVYPGMELTLGVPCQALILFDAEFPVELLPQIVTIIGVSQTAASEQRHAAINRLDQYDTIEKLHEELSRHSFLQDKFIILPNVSDGGTSTIIRSGFCSKYKNMPCVGGYVDGDISQQGDGNSKILAGLNKEYGNKRLAIFQTSDNRAADHAVLGTYSTWVKWATPTAEALRQACLAQESRISQVEPQYPAYQIQTLHVSNSRFMGPLDVEFNPQFNALIGGRGTGKSSILEYLRWALCDTPLIDPEDEGNHSLEAKRQQLVENTLTALGGEVRVGFSLNGVRHILRRNSTSGDLQVKVEAEGFVDITAAQVRQLFPIHAYSQKQLSGVGVKQNELFRFLLAPVEAELAKIDEDLEQNALSIKANYQHLQRRKLLEQTSKDCESQIKSIASQVQKLKENLSGLSTADKEIIDRNEKVLSEQTLVKSYSQTLEQLVTKAEDLSSSVKRALLSVKAPSSDSPYFDKVKAVYDQYSQLLSTLSGAAETISNELSEESVPRTGIRNAVDEWTQKVNVHNSEYEAAKQKYAVHETTIKEISSLEVQSKAKTEDLDTAKLELAKLSQAQTEGQKLRLRRSELLRARKDLIEGQCRTLNALSEGSLRASLVISFNKDTAQDQIKAATSGAKIRGKQFENLFTQISEDNESDSLWQDVLHDLEALVSATSSKAEQLPDCPAFTKLGFPQKELPKLAQYLTSDNWLGLSLIAPKEEVSFSYRVREKEYIPFSQASAGQQATVLLGVLLNQAGPPLVIDQPEDDLDNQVIQEVVAKVWNAKKKRQLLFTSHNANLVVNGDAELVICCGYRVAGDHSGGTIQTIGAIDLPDVRTAITTIMEGGKEAFNLRRQKYGF